MAYPFRPAHAGSCTLSTGSVTMDFRGAPANSLADTAQTTAAGWGSGALYSGHAQGGFPMGAQNPVTGNFGLRILAADTGDVGGYGDTTLPFVFATDTGGCSINFWRFKNPAAVSTLYTSPVQLDTSTTYVIDAAASCAPGMALAVAPIDEMAAPADAKAAVVAITPKDAVLDGTVATASLYIPSPRTGTNTFTKVDITQILQQAGVAFHSGTPFVLSDVDGDGRADLLVASSHQYTNELIVFYADPPPAASYTFSTYETLIADLGFVPPFAGAGQPVTGGQPCADSAQVYSAGPTGIVRQDFDGDGIADIVVSSVSQTGLHLFKGTSATTYDRGPDIASPQSSGTMQALPYDFTGDSARDIVNVKSGWGCLGKSGEQRILRNDGAGNFTAINQTFAAPYTNIDWSVATKTIVGRAGSPQLWYVRNYGLLFGKRTTFGDYSLWSNYPSSSKYVVRSQAVSASLTKNVTNLGNLVDVTLTGYTASTPSGTSIDFYLSADDGVHWELTTAAERAGTTAHPFTTYGHDLRWKAVFRGTSTPLTRSEAAYGPAANATAVLSGLKLIYRYAAPQRVSRSKVGYGIEPASGGNAASDLSFVASFDTPQMTGHVVLFRNTTANVGTAVGIETLNSSNDAAFWVRYISAGNRHLYGSQRTNQSTNQQMTSYTLRMIPLTTQELTASENTPTLQQQLGFSDATAASQLALLRGGVNPNGAVVTYSGAVAGSQEAVMRDPGHSNPAFWNNPQQDPNYMGNGYDSFALAGAKTNSCQLLLGTNDGMLHQFSGCRSMHEDWGLAPYNTLARMSQQIGRDSNGMVQYRHQTTVDGPVTIAEAYALGSGWKVLALVGQGQGSDVHGSNYYFAVDITDRDNPQPLWEFTEGSGGGTKTCDPNPCNAQVCTYPGYTDSSNCTLQNIEFRGELALNDNNHYNGTTQFGAMEAEHFDAAYQGTNPAGVDWVVVNSPGGIGADARGNAYIRPSNPSASCAGSNLRDLQACPRVSYSIFVEPSAARTYYPLFRLFNAPNSTHIAYTIDNLLTYTGQLTFIGSPSNGWQWAYGPAVMLGGWEHQLTVFMQDGNVALDAVLFQQGTGEPSAGAYETPTHECVRQSASLVCQQQCLNNPDSSEWPSCGSGQGQKCCASPTDSTQGYCQDVNVSCTLPTSNTGYGLSAPSVGRIRTSAGDKFVAFFASGQRSAPGLVNAGRSVYMVDVMSGTPMASWNFPLTGASTPAINPAIPGSVALVDVDNDGYVDRLYVGDLAGRLWKINTSPSAGLGAGGQMQNANQFLSCVVFDAGNPTGGGSRQWAPISMKPAVAIIDPNHPNVYFGTGGDASAPTNVAYSFYSVRDDDAMAACGSTPKREGQLTSIENEWKLTAPVGTGAFWSDPVVVDGRAVYFASTQGDPDAINPCVAANATSNVYGIAVRQYVDRTGRVQQSGKSVLTGSAAYYTTSGALRSGFVVRDRVASPVVRPTSMVGATGATDVLFADNTGTLKRLSTTGSLGADRRLKLQRVRQVVSW